MSLRPPSKSSTKRPQVAPTGSSTAPPPPPPPPPEGPGPSSEEARRRMLFRHQPSSAPPVPGNAKDSPPPQEQLANNPEALRDALFFGRSLVSVTTANAPPNPNAVDEADPHKLFQLLRKKKRTASTSNNNPSSGAQKAGATPIGASSVDQQENYKPPANGSTTATTAANGSATKSENSGPSPPRQPPPPEQRPQGPAPRELLQHQRNSGAAPPPPVPVVGSPSSASPSATDPSSGKPTQEPQPLKGFAPSPLDPEAFANRPQSNLMPRGASRSANTRPPIQRVTSPAHVARPSSGMVASRGSNGLTSSSTVGGGLTRFPTDQAGSGSGTNDEPFANSCHNVFGRPATRQKPPKQALDLFGRATGTGAGATGGGGGGGAGVSSSKPEPNFPKKNSTSNLRRGGGVNNNNATSNGTSPKKNASGSFPVTTTSTGGGNSDRTSPVHQVGGTSPSTTDENVNYRCLFATDEEMGDSIVFPTPKPQKVNIPLIETDWFEGWEQLPNTDHPNAKDVDTVDMSNTLYEMLIATKSATKAERKAAAAAQAHAE